MTETEAVDGIVLSALTEFFGRPDAGPINAPSVRWMLEQDHPDITIAQVLASFYSLAGAGEVRLMVHNEREFGVVECLAR